MYYDNTLCLMLISNQYDSEGQKRQPYNLSVSIKATIVLCWGGGIYQIIKYQSQLEQRKFINPLEVILHKLCKMFCIIIEELCLNQIWGLFCELLGTYGMKDGPTLIYPF